MNVPDPLPLPPRPDLGQYRKQAKELVKACESGNDGAVRGWAAAWLETLAGLLEASPSPERGARIDRAAGRVAAYWNERRTTSEPGAGCTLADAQFFIARLHGFESWPKFVRHIEGTTGTGLVVTAAQFASAAQAIQSRDVAALERLLQENPRGFNRDHPPPYVPSGPGPRYIGDARSIMAREHHFEHWTEFERHVEALNERRSAVFQFESAVDAVIMGDTAALERLLAANPSLIRARSARRHHATLLHYLGANGIEGFRQKTPKNAVRVAQILLAADAEVDAMADMYGGSTTLGLVATSIHPALAGVQEELLDVLLAHGAVSGAVNDCLANGRGEAAEFLANRGAALDLEGAAGVGRLDVVKRFFHADGTLKATATKTQLLSGFAWACEFGRTDVVDFLLQHGVDIDSKLPHNAQTGLHWAAYGGHTDTVRLLLVRRSPVNILEDAFGGSPLGWALYGWGERQQRTTRDRYYDVAALLVAAGASVDPKWLSDPNRDMALVEMVRSDVRMIAALGRPAWATQGSAHVQGETSHG